jgi:SAM-dependent methyltransferase
MPISGHLPRLAGDARLHAISFSSFCEFEAWRADNGSLIAEWILEDRASRVPGVSSFTVRAYCVICEEAVDFLTNTDFGKVDSSGEVVINWREQLLCPNCHMFNRVRAALHLSIQDFGLSTEHDIYITEQFGVVYRWMRGHFKHVIGSEYLYPGKASGFRRFGINHQDVHSLSMPSASLDFILSFDVLEHVPNCIAAFDSFARVLRPGGRLVMTVPFNIDERSTLVRAKLHGDGTIEHFLPIEIHGNPLDPVNGSLCFRQFGWDTLVQLTEAGFTDAKVHSYHDRKLGYLGGQQLLVSAVRA